MAYINPKNDYKDGDILYGIDLNASNDVIKAGVDDNFDRIQGLAESKQDVLTAGEGIQIENNVISNTNTVADWGDIEGNIEDQTDLKNALDAKQDVIDSSNKLDYSLLDNTPTIPSKTSDLTNDSGFIDNTYHDSSKQDTLTAGTGIDITNNVISNTQTSAEWGNITGTLSDQSDLDTALGGKQETLVSGTNIKTINNQSILGSGNISVGGGSGGTSDYDELENRPQINNVTLSGNKSLEDLGIQSKLDSSNKLPYSNISGTPTIPSKTSDLTNDSGFVDNTYHDNTKQDVIDNNNKLPYSYVSGTPNIPTKLSDLTNDNNTVTDAGYVHTDNNYTSAEKTKLAGIEAGAEVNPNVVNTKTSSTDDVYCCNYINDKIMKDLPTATNINSILDTGTYSIFHPTGTLPTGYAQADDIFILEVKASSNGRIQILHDCGSNKSFRRYDENMSQVVWSSWESLTGGDSIPVGMIFEFPTTDSTKLPTGYLFCDGSAISRTTYADLFAILGTKWGSGDGSTTFNLPTKEGLVTVGIKSSDTAFDTLGETGGEKTHTLTVDEMPSHSHKAGDADANWWATQAGSGVQAIFEYQGSNERNTSSTGGNQPHNNLQPYTVSNYIIKATKTTPVQAQVVNTRSDSTEDTYACDFINGKTGVILYNSGTVGDVTLSDSSANYSAIEVYAQKSGCWGSVKIYNPDGKQFGLSICNAYASTNIQQLFGNYTFSGNKIIKNRELYMNDNNPPLSSNDIAIQIVIGYK